MRPRPLSDFVHTASAGTGRWHTALSDTTRSIEMGLGHVDLPETHGMLFDFSRQPRKESTFWMKRCVTGLDMLFLSPERRVAEVVTLPAMPLNTPDSKLPFHRCTKGPIAYVLELKAGQSEQHGVRSGDTIELDMADGSGSFKQAGVHPRWFPL